jgi:hypothetical protein
MYALLLAEVLGPAAVRGPPVDKEYIKWYYLPRANASSPLRNAVLSYTVTAVDSRST